MKYNLIALDIDGTLVDNKRKLTDKNKEALFKAMDAGMIVVLSSGRPECGMVALADELELDKRGGYVSAFNGAKIIDWKTKDVVVSKPLHTDQLCEIYRVAKECDMPLLTHEGSKVITEDPDAEYVILEANINSIPVVGIESFEKYIDFPVYKFIAASSAEKMTQIEGRMVEELSKYYDAFRSNPYFLEIVEPGVDKGKSLLILADKLGIPREATIACGDGINDISMIKAAGLGIAMANAEEAVKAAADTITLSNEESGIAYLLDKLMS